MPGRRRRTEGIDSPPSVGSPELIIAGRALVGGRLQPVEIGVDETGFIRKVARQIRGSPRRDYGDHILIPSAVDLHVHLREPAHSEAAENFESGTEQGAIGGVSLVGDMPNTSPPIDRIDRLVEKEKRARGRLTVDVFLYALAQEPRRVPALAARAAGFKLYESPTTGVDLTPDEATRHALAEAVSQTGLPLVVHAEDPTQFRSDAPAHDPVEWDRERPRTAEMRGVESMLNSPSSLRLHFAHLTSSAAVEAVRTAGFSCEAAPHHLLLAAHESDDARWKTNPPLRTESVRQQLFESFQKGRVPILSSDHAPHFASEKSVPFDRAPSGVPGLATMIPLFLLEVREGRISLETLQSAACDRPARWAGVPQGRIAPGHRARLLAIDFRRRARVDARRLRIRCGWTPFEGREAIFPLEHLFDGEPLVADGEIVGGRKGQIVRPEYAPGARQRPESMA